MAIQLNPNETTQVRSFMAAEASKDSRFGDLLSLDRIDSERNLKVGLVSTGYFEFWPQYPNLLGKVRKDMKVVHDRLSNNHDIVYTDLVDTIDKAVDAGKLLRNANVDVIILEYRTYIPDIYIHHLLNYVEGIPLIFFASQDHGTFNWKTDYSEVYRNSGIMSQVQLVAGFRKMGTYKNRIEVIAGTIYDDEAYRRIDRYIEVVTIYKRLKSMTIGVIGNVFRGMFDFEFDKTKIKGALGPEVINVPIDHLEDEFAKAPLNDPDVQAMILFAKNNYKIADVGEVDLQRASRLTVALNRLVKRYRLDGIALLGQHFIEQVFKTQPYLALNELDREGKCLGVTEGDVIGLIAMKILKHLTGNTPFQMEYSEYDVERNAWMMLGHGHGDPTEARNDEAILCPACEHWGHVGTGVCTLMVPKPGPCTFAHFIEDSEGWKMYVDEAELMDLPPMPINEVHAAIKVEMPVLEYTEKLIKAGVPHHAMIARGKVKKEMEQLADLMGIRVVKL